MGCPCLCHFPKAAGLLTVNSVDLHSPWGSRYPAPPHQGDPAPPHRGDQACASPTLRLTRHVALKADCERWAAEGLFAELETQTNFLGSGTHLGLRWPFSRSCEVASALACPAPSLSCRPSPAPGPRPCPANNSVCGQVPQVYQPRDPAASSSSLPYALPAGRTPLSP